MKEIRAFVLPLLASLIALPACAQDKVYFGLLHAHTRFSDGQGTPEDAFAMAKQNGLDFFGVTPHNHKDAELGASDDRRDNILIATNHDLYESKSPVTITINGQAQTVKSVIKTAEDATDNSFVALYGQEFSSISRGNHVNVFNIGNVITAPNGSYRGLYDMLSSNAAQGGMVVVQLNHPDVHSDLFYRGSREKERRKMFNDYGIDDEDYGPDFADLVRETDRFVHLIEVLSGPAMQETGSLKRYRNTHEDDYYFYLVMGFHVSPSAGQDNHYKTWGVASDARTGVFCDSLTKEKLLGAFEANRTFATEDKNLSVDLTLNGTVRMGGVAMLAADSALSFVVNVLDKDEASDHLEVTLYHGAVSPGKRDEVQEWRARDGETESRSRNGQGELTFAGYLAQGEPEFYYVKVEQEDGDRAWSAPIWMNHPRAGSGEESVATEFVWSVQSRAKVYHDPTCVATRNITTQNRKTGSTPPQGWTKHNCVAAAESEEAH